MQSCFGILTITTISLLSLLVTIAGEFRVTNVTISNHVNVIVNLRVLRINDPNYIII